MRNAEANRSNVITFNGLVLEDSGKDLKLIKV